MAGHGRAPKLPGERRNATPPGRGEWSAAPSVGWQHGAVPEPPRGVHADTVRAWRTWFGAWFAAHWTPADVPGLRIVAQLHSEVCNGGSTRAPELRLWLDGYGITPKGQADRRWVQPKPEDAAPAASTLPEGPYASLRVLAQGQDR